MTEPAQAADDFLVVGIGASAGGIQAIKTFFEQVSVTSGMAYVVVLHLSPDHESRLAEVLQVSAPIPVHKVTERIEVRPDHVYVVSPRHGLRMTDRHLVPTAVESFEERRAPVDIFFRTLGEAVGARAAAVVLSGTGANGSMGLKRVKERGGVVLVQDPNEAEFGDMPRHAVATGLVDCTLSVARLPAQLAAFRDARQEVRLPEGPDPGPLTQPEESAIRDVLRQVRSRTGHDFTNYKQPTVLRRIGRRMSLHQSPDVASYARFLREHPEEVQGLLTDLLISVTNFFRDREAFAVLEQRVIPALFDGKGEKDQVRVWVAGCATGEEAYSIAMLLAEYSGSAIGAPSVQIFATDIDQAAIALARQGVYTLNDAADVSPERLRRFFTRNGDLYQVRSEVRELVLFADHNVIKDPPFSHLDLVSCRNLLIYLNREAQKRVLEIVHFALKTAGYLFLGASEAADSAGDLFVTLDKEAHIFQSRAVTARLPMPVPEPGRYVTDASRPVHQQVGDEEHPQPRLSSGDLHLRLLEQYAPPSVLVNGDYDILHLSEHAGRYLTFSGGEPSRNLLKVVHPVMRIELRTALYQAAQQRTSVEARGVSVSGETGTMAVNILVRPVLGPDDTARGFFLVIFQEVPDHDVPVATSPTGIGADEAARHFEAELLRVKAQLTATIERHETQSEELRASNEELQALNEELRSSAEELETSKEELQSLNEELRTVNQELKIKIEEQSQANDDVHNLVNSTEIGTIFLDRAMRIKLFTPRARELFTLIPADRGRPLSDITTLLVDERLETDIEQVLERLDRVERQVRSREGRWYLMRVLPYRTSDDRIDGVVLTFVDVTERTRAEERLRAIEARNRLILESAVDYAIFTLDAGGTIDSWNPGASRMFGFTETEAIGEPGSLVFTPEDRQQGIFAQEISRATTEGRSADERWHIRKDGTRFFASGVVNALRDERGAVLGFVKIARDLTERKRWEDELQRARAELEDRVLRRTAELAGLNQTLDSELRERRDAEERIRGLMRRLLTVQEDERRRIARDLHDHLGQQISALSLKLESLLAPGRPEGELQASVTEARAAIARIDRDLDFFTWELRPVALDDLGLVITLQHFVEEWSREFGVAAEFHASGISDVRLPDEAETNLYRITQEALNNVHKHAHASRTDVLLERRGDQLVLLIEDNGVGFEYSAKPDVDSVNGIGLIGMQERASFIGATLEIETAPGSGTTIFVRVPFPSPGSAGPPGGASQPDPAPPSS